MKPYWEQDDNKIYQGNTLEVLHGMAPESVQMIMTSPPYWGLRNYGLPPIIWDGDSACEHVWGNETIVAIGRNDGGKKRANFHSQSAGYGGERKASAGQFCRRCGAWRGCLGSEPALELFIQHMVAIFREARKILRSDGTLWLNLGDNYAGSGFHNRKDSGLKPKNLCGIPWRVVMAMQSDGWYLRSAMPWVKRSAMPESCSDRPGSALEYVFLLTKSRKYYFDMQPIRKDFKTNAGPHGIKGSGIKKNPDRRDGGLICGYGNFSGRNFRNTDLFFESIEPPFGAIFAGDELVGLDINTKGLSEAHFATFPLRLPEVAILAGTSEHGCCAKCGAPWTRVMGPIIKSKTIGWSPACKCNAGVIPCIVCDIFGGAMTTAIAAHKLNRKFIMIELSKKYIDGIGIPRIKKQTQQRRLWE